MADNQYNGSILCLDDEEAVLGLFKRLAEKKNFKFLETDDGAKALDILIDNDVDIIFSDINMPKMPGYEFVRYVREAGSEVPIYMITGAATPEERQTALDNGAQGIIPKPFQVPVIFDLLDKLYNKDNSQ